MGDPDEQEPPRERWLRVVRDGERPAPPAPEPGVDDEARETGPPPPVREPGTWGRPAGRQTWTTVTATAPAPPRPRTPPPPDLVAQPRPEVRSSPPVPDAPGRGHVARALGMLVAVVAAGTAGAVVADRLVGVPGDGHPALYVLVALALPFWDALPDRLGMRVVVVAAVIAAVAAAWFGLSLAADPPWWRAQLAFGVACLAVGTAHLLLAEVLRRRRTVG